MNIYCVFACFLCWELFRSSQGFVATTGAAAMGIAVITITFATANKAIKGLTAQNVRCDNTRIRPDSLTHGNSPTVKIGTCAIEAAWADKAYEVDTAHQWAECSNAGRCNRRTGICECSPGFTGVACEKREQRKLCLCHTRQHTHLLILFPVKCGGTGPLGCNGHGDCITLGQTYQMVASVAGQNLPQLYEKDMLPSWEANHVTMCSCHPGYSGASCEYRKPIISYYDVYRTLT